VVETPPGPCEWSGHPQKFKTHSFFFFFLAFWGGPATPLAMGVVVNHPQTGHASHLNLFFIFLIFCLFFLSSFFFFLDARRPKQCRFVLGVGAVVLGFLEFQVDCVRV
jgi:hypothetical protein